ncbi:HPP family protein [Paraburkholderia tropica]|uniref:HPP family protein n=1 Tax=Paraburkholderia tropica TaxID=92647 RepID=A0AAQ1GAN4_9BURK|nr:HPP family protein [Paraburkholderia tropica]RQN40139.1 HPP family protein [Paraburkholderia tropica]SEI82825.1 HPP family protein [Paraburkholderia tropica]
MTTPSAASASANEASTWRTQAGGILLAGLGAFVGLALVGVLAQETSEPWILGSFGATCVLLFGFPASPFSQPRNIIGGHVLTSLTGLVCLHLFGPGYMPMAIAAASALMLMMLTRTVHPPAGSNPVIIFAAQPGWSFLVLPTMLGAVALVLIGWIYWSVVKRGAWPHRPK